MFFKKWVKKQAKKVDKLITWIIIWTAVASMVWLSKTNRWKRFVNSVKGWVVEWYKKSRSIFWKFLVAIIKIFKRK
jgi:uncharacterized membrane protein